MFTSPESFLPSLRRHGVISLQSFPFLEGSFLAHCISAFLESTLHLTRAARSSAALSERGGSVPGKTRQQWMALTRGAPVSHGI